MKGIEPPEPVHAQLCSFCQRLVEECWDFRWLQEGREFTAFGGPRDPFPLRLQDCPLCRYFEMTITELRQISSERRENEPLAIDGRFSHWHKHGFLLNVYMMSNHLHQYDYQTGRSIRLLFEPFEGTTPAISETSQCLRSEDIGLWHANRHQHRALMQNGVSAVNVSLPMRAGTLCRNWLDACVSSHDTCKHSDAAAWRPSRLLYVEKQGEGGVRAVLHEAQHEDYSFGLQYMTLSHRWHGKEDLSLRLANRAQLRDDVPLQSLKQSVCDALWLCAEVNIPYLWVDSLCILQDDSEDRRKEIAAMDLVYGFSTCTIFAASATDNKASLFSSPHPLKAMNYCVQVQPQRKQDPWMLRIRPDPKAHDDPMRNSILTSRGWIFQERFLSTRTLHCCAGQILWECHAETASEAYPEGFPEEEPGLPSVMRQVNTRNLLRHWNFDKSRQSPDLILDLWARIVEKYTLCEMTFDRDRLRGLAGVTAYCKRLFKDECISGLWCSTLPQALLWESMRLGPWPKSLREVAPSWSWASVLSSISHPSEFPSEKGWSSQEFHVYEGERVEGQPSYLCRTLPADCFLSALPLSERAGIHLKGRTWKTSLHKHDRRANWELGAKPARQGMLLFIPILSKTFDRAWGRQHETSGLVLERLPHHVIGKLYRRLGTFTIPRTKFIAHYELVESNDATESRKELSGGDEDIYIT